MRGTQKSVSGTSSVKIEDSAGVPIKSIEITGNTVQDINLEQMDSYLDYFKNTNNYSSAGVSYTYRIALPSEWQGKELTFTLVEISKMTGTTVKLSDGDDALFSSSQILLSSSGEISSVTSKAYKYLIFTGVIGTPYEVDGIGYTELTEIIEFWNNYQMTVTGTMTAFPQPIQNANQKSTNLFDESTVTVGKEISADGVEGNNSYQRLSDYIEIEPSTTYRLSDVYNEFTSFTNTSQTQYARCACYDESKTLISILFALSRTQKGQHTTTFETPENAKYIRITQGKFAEKTMLTKGEDFVPYLPFGDYGSKVILHGKNLIDDVYNVFFHTATYQNNLKRVEKDGRNCIYYTFNAERRYVIEGGFKENTQYTISFDWFVGADKYGSGKYTPILTIQYTDGTAESINNNELVNNKYVPVQYEWRHVSYKTAAEKTVKALASSSYTNLEIWIDVDTFMFQEGAVETPYEPYFREEFYIPTSIDVDGTNVPLRFSEYDKLTVDRVSNKVVYINGTYIITYDENKINTSNIYLNPQAGLNFYFHRVANSTFLVNGKGLSTHFPRRPWYPLQTNYSFGALSDNNYTNIAFRLTGTETLAEFKQFMIDIANTGNPVIVQAQRFTPIEHDITSTDLGQALLSLCVPKGASGTLEITSNLEPTSLDVVYYSEIEEDKVELTVCYVNEAGEDIAEPKAYQVRRGSKYQMVVPHIDGYTRTQESVFGVASNNDVINLIYKEDNDVSV